MYPFTNQFISSQNNIEFLKAAMMGPNAMRVAEELVSYLNINENMRILDLGCGCVFHALADTKIRRKSFRRRLVDFTD
jgi:ubiquinone/menaquinone biosynthesis C-methylase UbiE